MTQGLSVQLFGQFRIASAADAGAEPPATPPVTPHAFRSQRLQSLLAYLILHHAAPVARPHLAFQLWPASTEAQALANLRNLLHHLRQALPAAERYVDTDPLTLWWRADAPAEVDVVAFEAALAAAGRRGAAGDGAAEVAALREAERRYTDDLLPACYDEWLVPERERLRLAFLAALEQLVSRLAAAGDPAGALPHAQRLVRQDPLHEAGYRQLLALYTASGDRVAALRAYQACAAVLERELGVAPSPATELAFERSQAAPPAPAEPASAPSAPSPPDRLPTPLTRFIGREEELAALSRRLAETRLLTLSGPGGAGKTRLALRLAELRRTAPELGGRLWWVDLAPVSDSALVGSAWLSALGAARAGEAPEAGVIAAQLGPAPALVVVDNCEHVVAEASALTEAVLARCPALTVLATSREPLGVAGEVVWPVRPLALPDRHWPEAPGSAPLPDAMALFVDRAAAAMPSFTLTRAYRAPVAAICRRVDGLPLAIELAASAVRVMSVADIAQRLETSLDLPPGRRRGGPARHHTLDAAIDWSYERLAGPEQALFRRLAIFAGGFPLAAAEALWPAEPGGQELLWLLAQLVDKSLVTVGERRGRTEYRLLEALRHYGRRALAAAGEAEDARARHAAYLLSEVERDHPQRLPAAEMRWLARIEAAEDDLRAALGCCAGQGEAGAEVLARLATGLVRYWRIRDRVAEASRWLGAVLAQPAGVPPRLRALALRDASTFAMAVGDLDKADGWLQESLALWQALGDPIGQAGAETALAVLAGFQGEIYTAWRLATDSRARYQAGGDRAGERHCLAILGVLRAKRGDLAAARDFHRQALALSRELGQRWEAVASLNHLTGIAVALGDTAEAEDLCDQLVEAVGELGDRTGMAEAQMHRARLALIAGRTAVARQAVQEVLVVRRELDDTWGTASSLRLLGRLECTAGDQPAAAAALRAATIEFQRAGDSLELVGCLEDLAHLAALGGHPERSAMLYAATAAWRAKTGGTADPESAAERGADLIAVREALGEAAFEAARAAGEAMPLEDAVAAALA